MCFRKGSISVLIVAFTFGLVFALVLPAWLLCVIEALMVILLGFFCMFRR